MVVFQVVMMQPLQEGQSGTEDFVASIKWGRVCNQAKKIEDKMDFCNIHYIIWKSNFRKIGIYN